MNEKDLLKEIGEIDEKFINEADIKSGKNNSANNRKKIWKVVGTLAACFVLVVAAGSVFIGSQMFRAGNSYEDAATMEMAPEAADMGAASTEAGYGGYVENAVNTDMQTLTKEKAADRAIDVSYEAEEGEVYNKGIEHKSKELIKQEVKLIYRAEVSVQTTKYDDEVSKIKARVEKFGGYIENMNEYNGGYYDNGSYKEGNFTVRIPKDKYREFLDGITENSHITNISENVEDVGEQYFDLESRLNMLRTKEERLQTLLRKANKLSDIIELESALSEVQYQIDMYQSDLNHYDSLIDYSTVNIYITQVAHVGDGLAGENNFFSRLGRSFQNGINGFVKKIDNFIMWISYNVITIGIIVIMIIVIWRFHLIRRIKEHIKR